MNTQTVRVNLASRSYDIEVTAGAWAGFGPFARERTSGTNGVIVTDERVHRHAEAAAAALAANGFQLTTVVLPSGEAQKSLAVAGQLYDHLAEIQADRQTLVIAVGGGVIGDLAGFV